MNHPTYPFNQAQSARYTFISEGRRKIEKIVEFTPTSIEGVFNLAFGDLLPDNSIDDTVNSNNGDIIKVLSTVIRVIKDFTVRFPRATIFVTGSSVERTTLYSRIIKHTFRHSKQYSTLPQ